MEQLTLNDEDLFTEASDELKQDIEDALEDVRDALPDIDEIMEVEGENIIGVLNGLKSDLEMDDGLESIREAKKWFEMGKRAESFDDEFTEETGEEIDALVEIVEKIDEAESSATELTDSIATLKKEL